MVNDDTLRLLRCPDDHSPLALADVALIAQLNRAISARQLSNRGGHLVESTLDGGLLRAAGDLLYPIVDQIPVMLVDEAIQIDQVAAGVPTS